MPIDTDRVKRECTLLLFVATPTEEQALEEVANSRNIPFEKIKDAKLKQLGWGEYHWMGEVGYETVIAVRPTKVEGRIVMGALGRLGVAAKAIRFQEVTGAKGIVQLGMAFGIDPNQQKAGDVLVSASLIPYDNRDVRSLADGREGYITDYSSAKPQEARTELLELFRREVRRGHRAYGVHFGALLSGAARIRSRFFRDELVAGTPSEADPIVGGDMEGVGLLAASSGVDDPIWCIVKGISDFADENRDAVIDTYRPLACRNAAEFVLDSLSNDRNQR